MKTRSQLKLEARRSLDARSARHVELKQQIRTRSPRDQARKKRKLKPQIQRSASSFCSSAPPSQPRMDAKSRGANGFPELLAPEAAAADLMALSEGGPVSSNGKAASSKRKHGEAHDWSIEETEWLLCNFEIDEWKDLYAENERKYSRAISKAMNKAFKVKHFNESIVRSKIRTLRASYLNHISKSGDTQSSSSTQVKAVRTINLLGEHRELLSSVFIKNKSTTSVEQQQEPKIWTDPGVWSKGDALTYMSLHLGKSARATNKIYDYSAALDSRAASSVLDMFPVVPTFRGRKIALDRLVRETKNP